MAIDWTLFKACNGLAGRSPVLDAVIRMLMNDYALTTALVLFLFALWFSGQTLAARARNQRALFSAIASMFLGNLLIKAMNLVLYRPRPFAYRTVTLLFYRPSDSSFPSNAAAVGFSIATSVWLFNRKVGLVLYVVASLLGLARICGGVHYPSDIVGGALIGMISAYLVARRMRYFDRLSAIIIRQLRRFLLA
jgi:undecaprenyl-diphosphatase